MTDPARSGPDPEFIVHIDGSSLRNPGPSGIGVRLARPDGSVVKDVSHSIGVGTNNQAEYQALLCALRELALLGAAAAEVRTDSQLLYSQVTGRFRVKNRRLRELHEQALALLSQLPGVRIVHVSRGDNSATDKLARAASAAAARALKDARP